jgi:hypothetical protein
VAREIKDKKLWANGIIPGFSGNNSLAERLDKAANFNFVILITRRRPWNGKVHLKAAAWGE